MNNNREHETAWPLWFQVCPCQVNSLDKYVFSHVQQLAFQLETQNQMATTTSTWGSERTILRKFWFQNCSCQILWSWHVWACVCNEWTVLRKTKVRLEKTQLHLRCVHLCLCSHLGVFACISCRMHCVRNKCVRIRTVFIQVFTVTIIETWKTHSFCAFKTFYCKNKTSADKHRHSEKSKNSRPTASSLQCFPTR